MWQFSNKIFQRWRIVECTSLNKKGGKITTWGYREGGGGKILTWGYREGGGGKIPTCGYREGGGGKTSF